MLERFPAWISWLFCVASCIPLPDEASPTTPDRGAATGGSTGGGAAPGAAGEGGQTIASGGGSEETEDCGGWIQLQCSEATDEPLQVTVQLDGRLDAILDVPVEAHCSPDVFFRWMTCIGLRPSLSAKSSEGAAVLSLDFAHGHGALLPFGEYVDSSGVRWTLEGHPDSDYSPVEPKNGVLDIEHEYLGRDEHGHEVELGVHAVACAGYYPCLL